MNFGGFSDEIFANQFDLGTRVFSLVEGDFQIFIGI